MRQGWSGFSACKVCCKKERGDGKDWMWPNKVTLANRAQPSGLLCLWQCLIVYSCCSKNASETVCFPPSPAACLEIFSFRFFQGSSLLAKCKLCMSKNLRNRCMSLIKNKNCSLKGGGGNICLVNSNHQCIIQIWWYFGNTCPNFLSLLWNIKLMEHEVSKYNHFLMVLVWIIIM